MKYSLFTLLFLISGTSVLGQSESDLRTNIVAINHDDLPKSDYLGTRQIYEKYGFSANFNFILTPFLSSSNEENMVYNVKKLIESGNHLGLHAIMGGTFWWQNKMFDVRPDGTASFAPTLEEIVKDEGGGKNIFGFDLKDKKIGQMGFATLPTHLSEKKITEMTENDYKEVIANYSFYYNQSETRGVDLTKKAQTWKIIHWMEYWYNELIDNSLGYSTIAETLNEQFAEDYKIPTGGNLIEYYPDAEHLETGKIIFFDDVMNQNYENPEYQKVGYFKRGLFKGCASTCNFEVADRCIDIAKAFCKYYFGTDAFTNYGRHGVQSVNLAWVDEAGICYDNRNKSIISGEIGKFFHSRTKSFMTGSDLLLNKGITMTSHPTWPRNPIFESQVGLYYGQSGFRYPFFCCSGIVSYLDLLGVSPTYSSKIISEEFYNSFVENESNLIQFFYENAGKCLTNANGESVYVHSYFKETIDYIRSCMGTGKIPCLSLDTIKDDPSVLNAIELLCLYCKLSGLRIVPFETARQVAIQCQRENEENFFPNPNFENTLMPIFDNESSNINLIIPDGWKIESGKGEGCSFTVDGKGEKRMRVTNQSGGAIRFGTKLYGLPVGEYKLSFYAKGDATIRLFLKYNSDYVSQYYGGPERFSPKEEIKTTSEFRKYTFTFNIAPPILNDYSYNGTIFNQYAFGYEDNISNVRFSIDIGEGNEMSLYGVELTNQQSTMNIMTLEDGDDEKLNNGNKDAIFNLAGQRQKSIKSGFNIINNKKIIIK